MPALPAIQTNPFLVPLRRSFIGAVTISGHTAGVLDAQQATTGIGALHTQYAPVHAALLAAYAARIAAQGIQEGKTASVNELLDLLSNTHIESWDLAIQQLHRRGTPRYIELLPDLRVPFQKGRQSERIAAVPALASRIGSEAGLASLKAEVLDFHADLLAAEAAQEGAKGTTEGSSSAMEAAVTAAAVGLFKVYGGLVELFAETPEVLGNYFLMELITDKEQTAFTGTVAATKTKFIAKRTLPSTASIRVVNSGAVPLLVYRAATKNGDPAGGAGLLILPGEDRTEGIDTFGSGPFLHIRNDDAATDGSFELLILPTGGGGEDGGGSGD